MVEIDRNAQRLRDLLEDLLSLSRIESREYRPELGPMPVTAAIDQVLDLRQQARFRVFEEQMDRRKLELVMRARQANQASRGRQ